MSIQVDVAALGAQMVHYSFCYLLTAGDDGRPHAVAVQPLLADGVLTAEAGRRTCANAAERPAVSLVFPPTSIEGYSLIVDGDATAEESVVRIVPVRAVLHRPAPAPERSGADAPGRAAVAAAGSCGSDCVELSG